MSKSLPATPARTFPMVGVYAIGADRSECRMVQFKAYDGDLAHAIELADLYAAIDGNVRAEVRRFSGVTLIEQETVAIRSPRSKTRRMLSAVYHGSTHSTYHHIRNRHVTRDPAPFPGDHYGPGLERLSSSVHVVISGRAGLFRDMTPVKATPHDLTAPIPYRPGIVRKANCDASRLPG